MIEDFGMVPIHIVILALLFIFLIKDVVKGPFRKKKKHMTLPKEVVSRYERDFE